VPLQSALLLSKNVEMYSYAADNLVTMQSSIQTLCAVFLVSGLGASALTYGRTIYKRYLEGRTASRQAPVASGAPAVLTIQNFQAVITNERENLLSGTLSSVKTTLPGRSQAKLNAIEAFVCLGQLLLLLWAVASWAR